MAASVDQDIVTNIKKEVEDPPESPEHTDVQVQDSPPSQADTNGSQKMSKGGWTDDQTRSMLELHKSYVQRFKDGNYSKKQLLDDVTQELNLIGYDATPEKVRNKMKYLKAKYKSIKSYNAKHVEKKVMPFHDELTELYSMQWFDDQEPLVNGNGLSVNTVSSKASGRIKRRPKSIPAKHVDLRTVIVKNKKSSVVSKASKIMKKRVSAKRQGQPLYQCGLCMDKFQSSSDMHGHTCKTTPVKVNNINKRKLSPKSSPFHWNSLITLHFLDILKDYQNSHKNANFRKGNIWENICVMMKKLGYKISPDELSKKWKILSASYEKTVAYNNTHKDKKRCAFFKRLMELHDHQTSFNSTFSEKNLPAKRTVQVSPFSFSQGPSTPTSPRQAPPSVSNHNQKLLKDEKTKQGNMSDLIGWLNNTWTEYKDMERKKQEFESQRHNEIMEMLSYLIEAKHH